ncbi:hypothetical protein ZTR_07732 [Talaromyces verruculosus]|nr:hypothetical protein ZTR_07732 [Talaromyces verruculosus]
MFQRFKTAFDAGCFQEEMAKIFAEQGSRTVGLNLLGSNFYQTFEPKNIQALLATQFSDFALGDVRRQAFYPMLGNGIFTADGKAWEHSKAMIRPQFVREQVADLAHDENHVQELLQQLVTDQSGWTKPTNITPLIFRLTFDSATEFLFGTNANSQRQAGNHSEAALFEWKTLSASFDSAKNHLCSRMQLAEFYWLHNPKELRDNVQEVHRFADYCVQNALKRVEQLDQQSEKSSTKQNYTFLDELAKVTKDPVELRSQTMNLLLAGRDTTASLLSWTIWLLARHPAVFNRLRNQILEDFGSYEQTEKITFSSLKACTYLQHVLNEVLRLYPPVPMNSRRAIRDTTLPLGGGPDGKSPLFVKKGVEVEYFVYVMHREEEFWGKDANEFNPDRWVDRKSGWEYLPFNGGPRICLGQQFALTEADYVITRLLQRFDQLKLEDESFTPVHRLGLTDAPQEYIVYLHKSN